MAVHRRRLLPNSRRRVEEDRLLRAWHRRVLQRADIPESKRLRPVEASETPISDVPGTRHPDTGAVLVEAALVLPLLTLLIVGGLILGAAQLRQLDYQQTAYETARAVAEGALTPVDAVLSLQTRYPAATVCVDLDGACFPSTLTGVQVSIEGPTFQHPTGSVTPAAQAVAIGGTP